MKRIFDSKFYVVLLLIVVLLFTACNNKDSVSTNEGNDNAGQAVDITIAHILGDTNPQNVALMQMAEDAKEYNININIVGNAGLGSEHDTINQMASGALDMALIQGVMLFEGYDPRFSIEDVPFLFENREQAYAAVDGEYGDKVTEILKDRNLNVLAFWENGFRHFTNNTRPIVNAEDMSGIKFRSSTSEMRLAMFEALGSNAVPMAFNELFTGLQQGTVDGQENPLSMINASKFYEVQDYLSLSGHIWSASLLVSSDKALEKLSDEQVSHLYDLAYKYREVARDLIAEEDQELLQLFEESGVAINEVNKEDFQEKTKSVKDLYIEKYGDELLKAIETYTQ